MKRDKNTRIKAILLDPKKREIHKVEFQGISQLYQILECDTIQGFRSYWPGKHNDEIMYFDEEALIRKTDEIRYAVGHAFLSVESVMPIIGRVIICRISEEGVHSDTSHETHEISRLVRWYQIPPRKATQMNNIIIN
jgi:hypothetical protein